MVLHLDLGKKDLCHCSLNAQPTKESNNRMVYWECQAASLMTSKWFSAEPSWKEFSNRTTRSRTASGVFSCGIRTFRSPTGLGINDIFVGRILYVAAIEGLGPVDPRAIKGNEWSGVRNLQMHSPACGKEGEEIFTTSARAPTNFRTRTPKTYLSSHTVK